MRSIVLLALLIAAPAAADEGDDAVARARADLQHQIERASKSGIVTIRGGKPGLSPAEVKSSDDIAATAPALRTFERSDCLTLEALALADAQLRDDPAGGLERLRRALIDGPATARDRRDLDLARGYLALGFAEEARAIATAHEGVEAAGISGLGFLAEGDGQSASLSVKDYLSCGGLYNFVDDVASVLGGETTRLSESAAAMLETLPERVRAPLSEALALAAVARNEDAPELIESALRHGAVSNQSDAGILFRALSEDDAAATRRLAAIAAEPGPIRHVALAQLGKRINASTPSDIAIGYGLDLEDEAAASREPQQAWALGLQLAGRRLSVGNIDGGVKALGAAFRNPSTRSAAIAKFRDLEKSLAASAHADQQLQHLAVIVADPELSAASLQATELKASARAAAALGAADALTRLMSAAPAAAAIDDLALGEALLRSGRLLEAEEIARENSKDPRFGRLALQLALASGDKDAELAAAKQLGPDEIGAAHWRHGSFAALIALDTNDQTSPETTKRIALAALALKKPLPPRTLYKSDETEGIAALFTDGESLNLNDLDSLRRFSEATTRAISFLKSRMSHE